eukprot:4478642-Amphidinium_carterae.1
MEMNAWPLKEACDATVTRIDRTEQTQHEHGQGVGTSCLNIVIQQAYTYNRCCRLLCTSCTLKAYKSCVGYCCPTPPRVGCVWKCDIVLPHILASTHIANMPLCCGA